jgi:hypothetical protein
MLLTCLHDVLRDVLFEELQDFRLGSKVVYDTIHEYGVSQHCRQFGRVSQEMRVFV